MMILHQGLEDVWFVGAVREPPLRPGRRWIESGAAVAQSQCWGVGCLVGRAGFETRPYAVPARPWIESGAGCGPLAVRGEGILVVDACVAVVMGLLVVWLVGRV